MDTQDRFDANLGKWARLFPKEAEAVKAADLSLYVFCTAEDGDQNLQKGKDFFHSQHHPREEAERWFRALDLGGVVTLFVFGTGLGYAYDALKDWLHADPARSVAFVECDLAVLHRLFETGRGTAMINDPQVWIYYFSDFRKEAHKFDEIAKIFGGTNYKVASLGYYLRTKAQALLHFNTITTFTLNIRSMVDKEYLAFGDIFFGNFYVNLLKLPEAYLAKNFYGRFKGVPAIICGAGPSLEKNIEVLKTLKDRALIFAGGTAMNALNSQGMIPHFGVGIDPNADQVMRVSNNEAYQTPYFYRNRMHANALTLIQGDHLYINGSVGYPIGEWVDKQLGIEGKQVPEGYNVINLSLSLAHELGCNPIICVGMDLAYSNEQSYSSGVSNHPINERRQQLRTKTVDEELVGKEDIHGNTVFTLWKWIAEGVWYAKTAAENRGMMLINATEGGIGFPGIPNLTLKEVAEKYLTQWFDFETLVHGITQEGTMPSTVTIEKIEELLGKLLESLQNCEGLCGEIADEFEAVAQMIAQGHKPPPLLLTDKLKKLVVKMDHEIAYETVLRTFNDYLLMKGTKELQRLEMDKDMLQGEELHIRKARLNSRRYESLQSIAKRNKELLVHFLENILPERRQPPLVKQEGTPPHVHENAALKQAAGSLDGHSIYQTADGLLLSEGEFKKGKREGIFRRYYLNGALYSIENYRNGVPDGEQRYFYNDGSLRTLLHYREGKYHGEVLLYYPNGQKKRELHFENGVKHGVERMWNDAGQLKIELTYVRGVPVGPCRLWFDNGHLAKEVIYSEAGLPENVSFWDKKGKQLKQEMTMREDYFDKVTRQTAGLTETIQNVLKQVHQINPMVSQSAAPEIAEELAKIEGELKLLQSLGDSLLFESGIDPKNTQEAIWKTPQARKQLEEKLKIATAQISQNLKLIKSALSKTIEKHIGNIKE